MRTNRGIDYQGTHVLRRVKWNPGVPNAQAANTTSRVPGKKISKKKK